MKKLSLILLTLLLVVPLFSQTDPNFENDVRLLNSLILNTELNDSVSKYYNFVYKAENEYMKQNYKKAATYYEKAFGYLKYPFMKDLYRAIYCEKESRKNIDNLKKYLELYLSKTKKTESTYDYSRNLPLQDSIEIVKLIDTIKPVVDSSLVNYLYELRRIDQSVRLNLNYPLSEEKNNLLITTDSINYNKLLDVIDKYPNLSEEIYGTAWGAFSIILNHCRSSQDIRMYIKLHNLVMNGQIDARNYLDAIEYSLFRIEEKFTWGGSWHGAEIKNLDTKDKVYIFIIPNSKEEKTINKYRKKVYLEDIKSYHKKRIWTMQTGTYIYNTTTMLEENDAFNKIILTNYYRGDKVKIYYKSKEDKKRIKKAMKEYNKNRDNNNADSEQNNDI